MVMFKCGEKAHWLLAGRVNYVSVRHGSNENLINPTSVCSFKGSLVLIGRHITST
jgi:hypothetical protein